MKLTPGQDKTKQQTQQQKNLIIIFILKHCWAQNKIIILETLVKISVEEIIEPKEPDYLIYFKSLLITMIWG